MPSEAMQALYGFTALHLAVYAQQEEAARVLLEAGAGVNFRSTGAIARVPPLGTAAFVRSVALARLLLDAGAEVNGGEPKGSPLSTMRRRTATSSSHASFSPAVPTPGPARSPGRHRPIWQPARRCAGFWPTPDR
jgi:hypothetical protein